MKTSKRIFALELAALAAVWAVIVAVTAARGAGTVALYAAAFGATVLVCGLELLRRAPG